VGINCALGAREMRPYLAELAQDRDVTYVSCYPNAGLPNAFGGYDETPETTGACCASSPRAASSTSSAAAAAPRPTTSRPSPRRRRAPAAPAPAPHDAFSRFSGPRARSPSSRPEANFLMIGERTNVTGSKRFAELIKAGDSRTALEVALDQVRGGANILDVNMDEGMLDGEAAMRSS
jgi:5-methyltetrahydrofolate--homocysteine methyltransferase